MQRTLELVLSPEEAFDDAQRLARIRKHLGLSKGDELIEQGLRRSIDARKKRIKVRYRTEVFVNEKATNRIKTSFNWQIVENKPEVLIIGSGPAGMFAALRLIEQGLKPIIIERGKDVRSRRRDLANLTKNHIVNEDSNYCFGEGGAGTYSDGKLYTRSKKRGSILRILENLYKHGAPEDILVDAHPHIGTNKLPKVVAAIRETILQCGGEINFDQRVTDFEVVGETIKSVKTSDGTLYQGKAVILATGHSARDVYQLLNDKDIYIEAKPFALGLRVEHPQSLVDRVQYHCDIRGKYLPAASYSLVHQTNYKGQQRGVFSFCMCPGGFIVPAATSQSEVVVNGMSPSKRNSKYANSGIVVANDIMDFKSFAHAGVFAGLEFQKSIEQKAWHLAGRTQKAPAQRLQDFVDGKISNELNDCSYIPGLTSVNLSEVLGKEITSRLRQAFQSFGKKMKGYLSNEANLVGVESRSSAPITIPRDRENCQHPKIKNLYPCGEGAGFAGGIVSAAMDGERVANAISKEINSSNH